MKYNGTYLQNTFFHVKLAEAFVTLRKGEYLFTGNYAVVNIDKPEVITPNVPSSFNLIPNETFVKNIKRELSASPKYCFTDFKNYYYYFDFKKLDNNCSIWLEGINNFNTHITRQINLIFKINNIYLYTDISAVSDVNNCLGYMWALIPDIEWLNLINNLLKTTVKVSDITITVYKPSKIFQDSSYILGDLLTIMNRWSNHSFLQARKAMIDLFKLSGGLNENIRKQAR